MRTWIVSVALAGSLAFATIAHAIFGELDPSFDGDGVVLADGPGGGSDEARSVAVQPDGKIVVAGRMDTDASPGVDRDFAVARYNANGSPDSAFGTDGLVTTDFGTDDVLGDLAIQPDGKLVVAGECDMGATGFDVCVARYNADGSLDSDSDSDPLVDFDTDGKVTTAVAPTTGEDYAAGVAIVPGTSDWDVVVAGGADMGGATDWDFLTLRYKSDGSLDTTGFGNPNGWVTTDFTENHDGDGDFGAELALQSNGMIVVSGDLFGASASDRVFGVARYDTNGSLDPAFDGDPTMPTVSYPGNGRVATSFDAGSASVRGVAIQGDGRIVVAGFRTTPSKFALARYNPADGSLDTSFDGDGRVETAFPGNTFAQDIAIDPTGKLVVAGTADSDPTSGLNNDFALARYNPIDGGLDPDFGGDGTVTASIAPAANPDIARALAVQGDGRIVAAGYAELVASSSESDDFAVARFGPGPSAPAAGAPPPTAPPVSCAGRQATITGTDDPDRIAGTSRADVIAGAGGNDTISGLGGNDLICGGAGNDTLKGGAGKDLLRGEAGKDTIKGGPARDICIGGAGRDKAAACERPKSL